MTLLKILASLSGLLYSILQVNYFGTSPAVEAYFVAASLMYLVVSLMQAGQLSEILLPVYHKIKVERGVEAAHVVFSIVINTVGIYLGLGLLVVFLLKDVLVGLIAPGFDLAQQVFTARIFITFLPLIFLLIMTSFVATWFNAEGKFGRVEFVGVINSVVSVVLLIVFHEYWGVWVLVVSIFIGKIVEAVVYLFMMNRYGYRHKWVLSVAYFNRMLFFRNMMVTFGYVLASQFYNIVITACATLLPQGTYAVFSYAQQLYVKATGFLVQPIQTYFFSKYSRNVSNNLQQDSLVPNAIRLYLAIYILVISLVYWSGKDILMLIWFKNTNPGVLALGATYLIANFATLIFSSIGGVYRKIAISHGEVKILYFAWIVCQLLSAASIYCLTKLWGEAGLTFAILFNLGLLNMASILIVHLKQHLRLVGLKLIVIKYSLLFVGTYSVAGLLYHYGNELNVIFSSINGLDLAFKLTSFSLVIVLVHLLLLKLLGEFSLLNVKRNEL